MGRSSARPSTLGRFALFQREYGYVVQSLRRLGVTNTELEDLTNEVFLVVHRRQDDYDPTRPIHPWLFGIAFRVVSEWRRKARHRRDHCELSDLDQGTMVDPKPSPYEQVEAREARVLVVRALASLGRAQRSVVVMADIDGIPVPQIAKALGIPLNTAYSRLRLGRARFTLAVRRLVAERT